MLRVLPLLLLLALAGRNVSLWARGGWHRWKDRYYVSKYGAEDGMDPAFRKQMFKAYAEGLAWVFRYYYTGVASWTWCVVPVLACAAVPGCSCVQYGVSHTCAYCLLPATGSTRTTTRHSPLTW